MRKGKHSITNLAPMSIAHAEKPPVSGHELRVMFYRQRDVDTVISWMIEFYCQSRGRCYPGPFSILNCIPNAASVDSIASGVGSGWDRLRST